MKKPNIAVLCRLIGKVLTNKHNRKWSLQYVPNKHSILFNKQNKDKIKLHKKYFFKNEEEAARCLQRIVDRFRIEGYLK